MHWHPCEAYEKYKSIMPTCPAKDFIYGEGKRTNEYNVHVFFTYQPNPETGESYGHFNFLMPPKRLQKQSGAPTSSSGTKLAMEKVGKRQFVTVPQIPILHSSHENITAFFARWPGAKKPQSKEEPPLPPPSNPPSPVVAHEPQGVPGACGVPMGQDLPEGQHGEVQGVPQVSKEAPEAQHATSPLAEPQHRVQPAGEPLGQQAATSSSLELQPEGQPGEVQEAPQDSKEAHQDQHATTPSLAERQHPVEPPGEPLGQQTATLALELQPEGQPGEVQGVPQDSKEAPDDQHATILSLAERQHRVEPAGEPLGQQAATSAFELQPEGQPGEVQGVPQDSKEAPDDQHATTTSLAERQHRVEPAGEPLGQEAATSALELQPEGQPGEVQGVPQDSKEAPDDQHATTPSLAERQHPVEPAGEPLGQQAATSALELQPEGQPGEVQGVPQDSKEAPDDQHATTTSLAEPQHPVQPAGEESEPNLFEPAGSPGSPCEIDSNLDTSNESDEQYGKLKLIIDRIQNYQPTDALSESETDDETENTSADLEKQKTLKSFSQSNSFDDSSNSHQAEQENTVEGHTKFPELEPTHNQSELKHITVLRLPGAECTRMCTELNKPHEVVMFWSSKKVIGKVYMVKAQSSVVVGIADVKNQQRISTFAELRRLDCFKDASNELKTVWKNRLLQEKKQLFVWEIACIQKFDKQLEMQGRNPAKHFQIEIKQLKSFDQDKALPGLDLKETAMYFVNRLSDDDLDRLKNTMKQLHNKEIKVGTACSGTDIAVSMTKATVEALAEHFNVSWPKFIT